MLLKWLEDCNTDTDIAILLAGALLYIAGERNDLPKCKNLTLHSGILSIGWSSIILGILPTSLAYTQKTYFTHIGRKTGLTWAIQLITQICRLIYGQWHHRSKLKHALEALYNNAKELILDAEITDKHEQVQDTLTNLYNPYFGTPLSIILDTSITARNIGTT